MVKRYRTLKAKPGELRVYYGKADRWSDPDVCYAWGEGSHSADARMLHSVISVKRMVPKDISAAGYGYEQSLIDELKERGYDITTLRFCIQKTSAARS